MKQIKKFEQSILVSFQEFESKSVQTGNQKSRFWKTELTSLFQVPDGLKKNQTASARNRLQKQVEIKTQKNKKFFIHSISTKVFSENPKPWRQQIQQTSQHFTKSLIQWQKKSPIWLELFKPWKDLQKNPRLQKKNQSQNWSRWLLKVSSFLESLFSSPFYRKIYIFL